MVNKRGFLKIINLSLDMILNLVGVEVIAILDYMTTQVIEVGLHLWEKRHPMIRSKF